LEFDNLSLTIKTLTIVDGIGSTIYRKEKIEIQEQNLGKININGIRSGIYNLVIETEDQRIVKRLMILE